MPLPLALIGGAAKIAGSLIGGRARRREAASAAAQKAADLSAFRNFQFTNEFSGMENVFEDATINQQATQFQAAETDRALANSMQAAIASGGAAGGAQAIAQAALQSKQNIAADIAAQESANQSRMLEQESALMEAEARTAQDLQQQRYQQAGTNLKLSSARDSAARAAKQRAASQLLGGITSFVGGVGSAFGDKFGTMGKGKDGGGTAVGKFLGGIFGG